MKTIAAMKVDAQSQEQGLHSLERKCQALEQDLTLLRERERGQKLETGALQDQQRRLAQERELSYRR
jgi:hypothetical protein